MGDGHNVLEILKQKEDWKYSVEIKENASGQPSLSVKTRSDDSAKAAFDEALREYKSAKKQLQEMSL